MLGTLRDQVSAYRTNLEDTDVPEDGLGVWREKKYSLWPINVLNSAWERPYPDRVGV